MKKILLLLLITGSVQAQVTTYQSPYGVPQGTATQAGNTTYYQNSAGKYQGSATTIPAIPVYNYNGVANGSTALPIATPNASPIYTPYGVQSK